MDWRGAARWYAGGLAAATIGLAVTAPPAAAQWAGTLERTLSSPSGPQLVLALHNNNGSFGMHFGLVLPGYTVSNVSADVPGPFGRPACTPTANSDLTTGNAGIDCTFQNQVVNVFVTFTTSPRYPDDGNGVAFDDDDSTKTQVIGPSPPPPVKGQTVKDIKSLARDVLDREWTTYACNQIYSADGISPISAYGLAAPALAKVFQDRESCYKDIEGTYRYFVALGDPPDQDVLGVALPRLRPPQAPAPCPRAAPKRGRQACAMLRRLVQTRDRALGRDTAVWTAIVTTLNRLSTAVAKGDSTGGSIQNAALIADAGELLKAGSALDAADAALARKLTALHLSPAQPRKQAVAGWKAVRSGKLPTAVVAALRRDGITRSALRSASAALPRPRGALTLKSILRQPAVPGSSANVLAGDVKTLTPNDLSALAKGLQNAGSIDQALANALISDAKNISAASSPSARAGAVKKAIADAGRAPGEAGALLTVAARALAG